MQSRSPPALYSCCYKIGKHMQIIPLPQLKVRHVFLDSGNNSLFASQASNVMKKLQQMSECSLSQAVSAHFSR